MRLDLRKYWFAAAIGIVFSLLALVLLRGCDAGRENMRQIDEDGLR